MEKKVDVNDELSTEIVVKETVEITPMLGSTTENVVESDNGKKDDAIDINNSITEMVDNMAVMINITENPSDVWHPLQVRVHIT